jgi:hypothetical protein
MLEAGEGRVKAGGTPRRPRRAANLVYNFTIDAFARPGRYGPAGRPCHLRPARAGRPSGALGRALGAGVWYGLSAARGRRPSGEVPGTQSWKMPRKTPGATE